MQGASEWKPQRQIQDEERTAPGDGPFSKPQSTNLDRGHPYCVFVYILMLMLNRDRRHIIHLTSTEA